MLMISICPSSKSNYSIHKYTWIILKSICVIQVYYIMFFIQNAIPNIKSPCAGTHKMSDALWFMDGNVSFHKLIPRYFLLLLLNRNALYFRIFKLFFYNIQNPILQWMLFCKLYIIIISTYRFFLIVFYIFIELWTIVFYVGAYTYASFKPRFKYYITHSYHHAQWIKNTTIF